MARTKRQLLGRLRNEEDEVVWVYKAGRSYQISHQGREHLCHPSVRSLEGARREAMLVFHVKVPLFEAAG
jgi:hypothetical protein